MDRVKNMAKGGWHPKNDPDLSKRPSARGDFKGIGQVASFMGKGKTEAPTPANSHSAAPLSTLKDPSTFGPPPKHVALSQDDDAGSSKTTSTTKGRPTAPRTTSARTAPPQPPRNQTWQAPEQQVDEYAPPTLPARSGTTPTSPQSPSSKPAPPPRLPPRQNSHPDVHSPDPPPAYTDAVSPSPSSSSLNPAATSRLAQSGVSVPSLNIHRTASPAQAQPAAPTSPNQLNELQSRFSRLGHNSSTPPSPAHSPSRAPPASQQQQQLGGGTTWQQKQSALRTASSFHRDPSSVSMSDAKDAAGTANDFRQRHGEQVKQGWGKVNGLNQKYGVTDSVRGAVSQGQGLSQSQAGSRGQEQHVMQNGPVGGEGGSAAEAVAAKKAPPPPPPPKKRDLGAARNSAADFAAGSAADGEESAGTPPPIPLASKPR